MKKASGTELKTKIGIYMREVRAGREVVITDRGEPVARLVPFRRQPAEEAWELKPRNPQAPALGEVQVRGVRVRGLDSLALLREDRDKR